MPRQGTCATTHKTSRGDGRRSYKCRIRKGRGVADRHEASMGRATPREIKAVVGGRPAAFPLTDFDVADGSAARWNGSRAIVPAPCFVAARELFSMTSEEYAALLAGATGGLLAPRRGGARLRTGRDHVVRFRIWP